MTTPSKPPVNRTSLASTIGNTHRRTRGLEAAQMMPYYACRAIYHWDPSEVMPWSDSNTNVRSTTPFDSYTGVDDFFSFDTDETIFEPAMVDPFNPSDGQYRSLRAWGEGLFQWSCCVTGVTTGAHPGPWKFRAEVIWDFNGLTALAGPDINMPFGPYWDDSATGKYYGKADGGTNLVSQVGATGIWHWDPQAGTGIAPFTMPRDLQIYVYKGLVGATEPTADLIVTVDFYIERLTPIGQSYPSE